MASASLSLEELPLDLLRVIVGFSNVGSPSFLPLALAPVSRLFNRLARESFGIKCLKICAKRFLPGLTLPFHRLLSSTSNGGASLFEHFDSFPLIGALNKSLTTEILIDFERIYEPFHRPRDNYGGGFYKKHSPSVALEKLDEIVGLFPSLQSLEIRHCTVTCSTLPPHFNFPNLKRLNRLVFAFGVFSVPLEALDSLPGLRILGNLPVLKFDPRSAMAARLDGLGLFSFSDLDASIISLMSLFEGFSRLKTLILHLDEPTPLVLESVSLSSLESLEHFEFFAYRLVEISYVPDFSNLRTLKVCSETVDIFNGLPNLALEKLSTFELRVFRLDDETTIEKIYEAIRRIKDCKSLKKFRFFSRDQPGSDFADQFVSVGQLPSLETLSLWFERDDYVHDVIANCASLTVKKLSIEIGDTSDIETHIGLTGRFPNLTSLKLLLSKPRYGGFTLPPLLNLTHLESLDLCAPLNQRDLETCMAFIPNSERISEFLAKMPWLKRFTAYLDYKGGLTRWREVLLPRCPHLESFSVIESYRTDAALFFFND